jgi:hypothetical protein
MSDLRALAHHLAMHPSSKRDKIEDDIHAALLLARSEALEEAEAIAVEMHDAYVVCASDRRRGSHNWYACAKDAIREVADAIAATRRGER